MKKIFPAALILALAAMLLCGCGQIIVEDAETVRIGMESAQQD